MANAETNQQKSPLKLNPSSSIADSLSPVWDDDGLLDVSSLNPFIVKILEVATWIKMNGRSDKETAKQKEEDVRFMVEALENVVLGEMKKARNMLNSGKEQVPGPFGTMEWRTRTGLNSKKEGILRDIERLQGTTGSSLSVDISKAQEEIRRLQQRLSIAERAASVPELDNITADDLRVEITNLKTEILQKQQDLSTELSRENSLIQTDPRLGEKIDQLDAVMAQIDKISKHYQQLKGIKRDIFKTMRAIGLSGIGGGAPNMLYALDRSTNQIASSDVDKKISISADAMPYMNSLLYQYIIKTYSEHLPANWRKTPISSFGEALGEQVEWRVKQLKTLDSIAKDFIDNVGVYELSKDKELRDYTTKGIYNPLTPTDEEIAKYNLSTVAADEGEVGFGVSADDVVIPGKRRGSKQNTQSFRGRNLDRFAESEAVLQRGLDRYIDLIGKNTPNGKSDHTIFYNLLRWLNTENVVGNHSDGSYRQVALRELGNIHIWNEPGRTVDKNKDFYSIKLKDGNDQDVATKSYQSRIKKILFSKLETDSGEFGNNVTPDDVRIYLSRPGNFKKPISVMVDDLIRIADDRPEPIATAAGNVPVDDIEDNAPPIEDDTPPDDLHESAVAKTDVKAILESCFGRRDRVIEVLKTIN